MQSDLLAKLKAATDIIPLTDSELDDLHEYLTRDDPPGLDLATLWRAQQTRDLNTMARIKRLLGSVPSTQDEWSRLALTLDIPVDRIEKQDFTCMDILRRLRWRGHDPAVGVAEAVRPATPPTPAHNLADHPEGAVDEPDGATGKGMTWREAKKVAEAHCARNPFPGVNALASIVRQTTGRTCSKATIRKAIDRSAKLRAKLADHEAQRKSVSAGAMSEGDAASAKQSREPDPIDAASASTDDLFHLLLEQATAAERARLNAMSDAQRRELVAAMDEHSIRELVKPRTR